MGLGQVSLEARFFLGPAPIIDLVAMTAKLLIAGLSAERTRISKPPCAAV